MMKTADIVIVDDNTANLNVLSLLLRENGYRVRPVNGGRQALKVIENHPPDLVLLDVNMPEMSGYEVCKKIKVMPATKETPIIFISAADDLEAKIEGFAAGGLDYITKPFQEQEVLLRVSTHLRIHHLQQQLTEKVRELERANRQILELSIRDELTQLHNRRYFNQQAALLLASSKRFDRTFCIMIGDIDHFKRVNDTYSHSVGDDVLRVVGKLLAQHTRATDIVARYGGEEFVIGLPETTLAQAVQVCDKLRGHIESYPWHTVHANLNITMSMGVAASAGADNHEAIVAAADLKLYEAKHSGRNQVRC